MCTKNANYIQKSHSRNSPAFFVHGKGVTSLPLLCTLLAPGSALPYFPTRQQKAATMSELTKARKR